MAMTNEERLAQIKARVDAATPGPWVDIWATREFDVAIDYGENNEHVVIDYVDLGEAMCDLDFILNSRQDIPWLIEELERLHANQDRAVQKIKNFMEASKDKTQLDRGVVDFKLAAIKGALEFES